MPMHQATAMTPLLPIGVPISRPRTVSMIGVNGWYSANQRSPAGIDSVGTNPLPKNGSSTNNMGELLAVSTLLAFSPSATESQMRASDTIASKPAAASHSATLALGRKPTSSATPMTTTMLVIV